MSIGLSAFIALVAVTALVLAILSYLGYGSVSCLSKGKRGCRGSTGFTGDTGATGLNGSATNTGSTGPLGPFGATGPAGTASNTGATGPFGATGSAGATGNQGATGFTGATGAAGTAGGLLAFADFFALMPGDNAATVAVGAAVSFPQNGATSGATIARTGPTTFNLAAIGVYEVTFQVSVTEAGQLVIALNGTQQASTVVGRATGTSQIFGSTLITTTTVNTVLSINNPLLNSTALTITPLAGGANAVSATLVIKRLA